MKTCFMNQIILILDSCVGFSLTKNTPKQLHRGFRFRFVVNDCCASRRSHGPETKASMGRSMAARQANLGGIDGCRGMVFPRDKGYLDVPLELSKWLVSGL